MTGEEKKAILEQARAQILEIECLRKSMETVESWAEIRPQKFRESGIVKGGKRADKVAEGAAKLVDLNANMSAAMCGISERVSMAYEIIAQAAESIDRVILMKYYIHGCTWETVADTIDRDPRTCMRRRDNALGIKNTESEENF